MLVSFCNNCEAHTHFDDSGYCKGCGAHYDNVGRPAPEELECEHCGESIPADDVFVNAAGLNLCLDCYNTGV